MHQTVGGEYNATPPTYTDKQLTRLQADASGNLKTVPAIGGTAVSTTNPVPTMAVDANATTTTFANAANTTPVLIASGGGRLLSAALFNYGAAARYVKFYNKATAPTVGTDVPWVTFNIGASGLTAVNPPPTGYRFTNNLYVVVTVNSAISDTTAGSANDVVGLIETAT